MLKHTQKAHTLYLSLANTHYSVCSPFSPCLYLTHNEFWARSLSISLSLCFLWQVISHRRAMRRSDPSWSEPSSHKHQVKLSFLHLFILLFSRDVPIPITVSDRSRFWPFLTDRGIGLHPDYLTPTMYISLYWSLPVIAHALRHRRTARLPANQRGVWPVLYKVLESNTWVKVQVSYQKMTLVEVKVSF